MGGVKNDSKTSDIIYVCSLNYAPPVDNFKSFLIKVGLVFLISNFFTDKISQANDQSVVYLH